VPVTFDYLQHQDTRIEVLVAILIGGQYKAVKKIEGGSTSIKYMLTHYEGCQIGIELFELFNNSRNVSIVAPDLTLWEAFHNPGFIHEFDLGGLNEFHGFDYPFENEVRLKLIVDNLYDLDGQLEISLALSFNEEHKVIFDKWSPWKSKKLFQEITHTISPRFDNFDNRIMLLNELTHEIFEDFEKSIERLKTFLNIARNIPVNKRKMHAIYLDLKNRNRSITSLTVGNQNMERIKGDLDSVSYFIRRSHRPDFNYVDFLPLIAKKHTRFVFENHSDFEISENRSYKALLKIQEAFSRDNNRFFNYEEDQVELLDSIVNEFPDYFRGLEF
jgi:hypothetical protein